MFIVRMANQSQQPAGDSTETKDQSDACEKRTLLQALHDKYGCDSDEPLEIVVCVSKHAPGKTESGVLHIPSVLGLNNVHISEMGDVSELTIVCSHVTELDLSHNDISSWAQVSLLLKTLPKLQFLNLSYNPLHLTPPLCDDMTSSIPADLPLTRLILNGTGISWDSLWTLLKALPCIAELHFCKNGVSGMDRPQCGGSFPLITQLFISENNIENMEAMLGIGDIIPQLKSLVIINNPIKTLSCSYDSMFPCLENINLSQCPIEDWTELVKLQLYPKLADVRMLEIPLKQKYKKKLFRQLIISYLPNIVRLNSSSISASEREDAERAFIRLYMHNKEQPPRYEELVKVHGIVNQLATVDMRPSSTVSVTVVFDGKTSLEKISKSWNLTQLKIELAPIVEQMPQTLDVFHENMRAICGPEEMKLATRTMLRYGVDEGDALHVFLKRSDVEQDIKLLKGQPKPRHTPSRSSNADPKQDLMPTADKFKEYENYMAASEKKLTKLVAQEKQLRREKFQILAEVETEQKKVAELEDKLKEETTYRAKIEVMLKTLQDELDAKTTRCKELEEERIHINNKTTGNS